MGKDMMSNTEVQSIVLKYHLEACMIPIEHRQMIVEIVQHHMSSLSIALGNLELMYRRVKCQH